MEWNAISSNFGTIVRLYDIFLFLEQIAIECSMEFGHNGMLSNDFTVDYFTIWFLSRENAAHEWDEGFGSWFTVNEN